jgi:hypothetical protein
MLALVSTKIAIRRGAPALGLSITGCLRNGRAKASAIRHSTRHRNTSSSQCSRRLRRVSRGGEAKRNISELNGFRSRVLRRIK